MKHLRDIVRESIEKEILKNFFKERYDEVDEEEKNKTLKLVSFDINKQVDMILNAFLEDIEKTSPKIKQRKYTKVIFMAISLAATAGVGLAVNQENWPFLAICSLVILGIEIYQIFFE